MSLVETAQTGVSAIPALQVTEPMVVVHLGAEHAVAAWGVQGFRLAQPLPQAPVQGRGRVTDVTLLIGRPGTRIEMQVQARAVEVEGASPLDYRFVDLARPQAEMLHRIVDLAVNRKAMSLTRLLDETEETRVARHETQTRTQNGRRNLQLALVGVALAFAGNSLWGRFTTVEARYAAVTASATAVTPATAGLLAAVQVNPGQSVMPGDMIAQVRSADHERRLQAIVDERQRTEAEQLELTARRASMTQIGSVTGQGHDTERARLDEALRNAERRLAAARAQLAELRANGLPTARRQAERAAQESAVFAAEQDLIAVRRQVDALGQSVALAGIGVMPVGGAGSLGTLDALDLRLSQLAEQLAAARLRESQSLEGEPVFATCDCVVARVERRPGEFVDSTRPIVTLVERSAPTIHALVMSENARSIRVGDPASIDLADGSSLTGRVARLDYSAYWPGYSGLQDNVFAADRYARVEILPDEPLRAPVGMTAAVSVSTDRVLAPLLRFVGL